MQARNYSDIRSRGPRSGGDAVRGGGDHARGFPRNVRKAPAAGSGNPLLEAATDKVVVDAAGASILLNLSCKAGTVPAAGRTDSVQVVVDGKAMADAAVETMTRGRPCKPGITPAANP